LKRGKLLPCVAHPQQTLYGTIGPRRTGTRPAAGARTATRPHRHGIAAEGMESPGQSLVCGRLAGFTPRHRPDALHPRAPDAAAGDMPRPNGRNQFLGAPAPRAPPGFVAAMRRANFRAGPDFHYQMTPRGPVPSRRWRILGALPYGSHGARWTVLPSCWWPCFGSPTAVCGRQARAFDVIDWVHDNILILAPMADPPHYCNSHAPPADAAGAAHVPVLLSVLLEPAWRQLAVRRPPLAHGLGHVPHDPGGPCSSFFFCFRPWLHARPSMASSSATLGTRRRITGSEGSTETRALPRSAQPSSSPSTTKTPCGCSRACAPTVRIARSLRPARTVTSFILKRFHHSGPVDRGGAPVVRAGLRLGRLGQIYYRRRLFNEERKSGNVRIFLNTWASAIATSFAATRTASDERRDPGGPGQT